MGLSRRLITKHLLLSAFSIAWPLSAAWSADEPRIIADNQITPFDQALSLHYVPVANLVIRADVTMSGTIPNGTVDASDSTIVRELWYRAEGAAIESGSGLVWIYKTAQIGTPKPSGFMKDISDRTSITGVRAEHQTASGVQVSLSNGDMRLGYGSESYPCALPSQLIKAGEKYEEFARCIFPLKINAPSTMKLENFGYGEVEGKTIFENQDHLVIRLGGKILITFENTHDNVLMHLTGQMLISTSTGLITAGVAKAKLVVQEGREEVGGLIFEVALTARTTSPTY